MSDAAICLDDRWAASRHVHYREFDGELVMLDLDRGQYFAIDGTGVRMWHDLAAGRSLAEIAHDLAREYDVAESIVAADCLRLASDLIRRGLLVRKDATGRGLSERSTRLVHLVSRAALRLMSPRHAKLIAEGVGWMLPPLGGTADARIAMKILSDSGTCLTRAFAIASRLQGAQIVIGVDPSSKPVRSAHAWVEFEGTVIETVSTMDDGFRESARSVAEIARLSSTRHRVARTSTLSFRAALHQVTELFRRFR